MDHSPQSSLAKSVGSQGSSFYTDDVTPRTGDFYLIAFIASSTVGHLYDGSAVGITGKAFPAGFTIGGTHSLVQLNAGSALVYGNLT